VSCDHLGATRHRHRGRIARVQAIALADHVDLDDQGIRRVEMYAFNCYESPTDMSGIIDLERTSATGTPSKIALALPVALDPNMPVNTNMYAAASRSMNLESCGHIS